MPEHDGLMRIFWPLDIPKSDSPGVIVGWRNSGLDVFVVAILEDVDARNVENALKVGTLFRNAAHPIARIHELCGQTSMHVLGLANTPGVEVENLQMHAVIGSSSKTPQIYCARASTIQIIGFDRPLPHRMQYISLNPISLALGDKSEVATHAPGTVDAEEEREELKNRMKVKALVEKLKLHTIAKHPASPKELALPRIVNQINCSSELHALLQKNISLVGRRSRRSLSVSERVVESATTMKDFVVLAIWQIITVYLYPIIRRAFIIGLLGHRIAAETLLLVLEWRAKPDYAALKDISATAQQVEIRLLQFSYWPLQVPSLLVKMDLLAGRTCPLQGDAYIFYLCPHSSHNSPNFYINNTTPSALYHSQQGKLRASPVLQGESVKAYRRRRCEALDHSQQGWTCGYLRLLEILMCTILRTYQSLASDSVRFIALDHHLY
ncbi:hypothetical protein IFR04_010690 [Cadophora malorum]|uniref:Uncharacterized protein n=1 Tax=Cadophora malorum TaxID=108018 RepID=A0A8H7W3B5_9HELO|nr:hypothetical protein IFR04_010690 [Cadophora malorum]